MLIFTNAYNHVIVGNVAGIVAWFIDANVVIGLDGQVLFMVLKEDFI